MFQFLVQMPRQTTAALLIAGCGLAACAQIPAQQTAPAPVASAVPERSIAARVIAPVSQPEVAAPGAPVVESAVPTPGPTGPLDARTGLHQSALVSVSGNADSQFIVLFRPGQTSSSNVEAAPGKLCGGAGVASSRTNSPGSGSAMPGVQTMIVKCNAAA